MMNMNSSPLFPAVETTEAMLFGSEKVGTSSGGDTSVLDVVGDTIDC